MDESTIDNLYDKIDKIFIDHTTHQWKNGWQHEGDRESEELTIQKEVYWNNQFLLERHDDCLKLQGPYIDLTVKLDYVNNSSEKGIRVDIRADHITDIHKYYYVDNEIDWQGHEHFILSLCQKYYDSVIELKKILSLIPDVDKIINPSFAKEYRRDKLLKNLLD